jgi:aspartyl protease family protein
MGLTYVNVTIASPTNLKRQRRRKLLADSGALYTIVPKEILKAIGVKPYGAETFTLADGSTIRREVGNAFLQIDGRQAPSPIIFGEKGDGSLLGVIALESLGFTINPRTGRLVPTPLFLMSL